MITFLNIAAADWGGGGDDSGWVGGVRGQLANYPTEQCPTGPANIGQLKLQSYRSWSPWNQLSQA